MKSLQPSSLTYLNPGDTEPSPSSPAVNRKALRVDSAQFKEALNTQICLHNLLSDWKCQRADGRT